MRRGVQAVAVLVAIAAGLGLVKACNSPVPSSPDAGDLPSLMPRVLAIQPATCPEEGGVTVSIRGKDFHPWARVHFGNYEIGKVNVISDREIRVVAPAGIGTVGVTVINPGGQRHELGSALAYTPLPEEPGKP